MSEGMDRMPGVKLYTASAMREMDRLAIAQGIPGIELMEAAGAGTARLLLADARALDPICVLAGAGNNGGDALVVARLLREAGRRVKLVSVVSPEAWRGEAALAWERLRPHLEPWVAKEETLSEACALCTEAKTIVDGLFGTGLTRPPEGVAAALIEAANAAGAYRVALDLPSGLSADTGTHWGAVFRADLTTTYAGLKLGLLMEPGASLCGRLVCVDIGVPEAVREVVPVAARLFAQRDVAGLLPPREAWAHKGSFGHVLLVAGSSGMHGAALLAASGALASGAGLISLASDATTLAALTHRYPEALSRELPSAEQERLECLMDAVAAKEALVVGPGLGRDSARAKEVASLLLGAPHAKAVVDADALFHLASLGLECTCARARLGGETILTPHPKEAARLLQTSVEAVQADRAEAARELAGRAQAHVVLKGARTLIAAPDGALRLMPYGDTGLAKGGSGDVLAGLIGGLLAQGLSPLSAALIGTTAHALAGELLSRRYGTRGAPIAELSRAIGRVWAAWEKGERLPARAESGGPDRLFHSCGEDEDARARP